MTKLKRCASKKATRYTRGVSVFPVGLVGKFGLSSPVVKAGLEDGKQVVEGWYDYWDHGRKFMLDMAGFALSVALYKNRSQGSPILMPPRRGREEDDFLKMMGLEVAELEVISPDEVLVWHTKTADSPMPRDPGTKYKDTNVALLWSQI